MRLSTAQSGRQVGICVPLLRRILPRKRGTLGRIYASLIRIDWTSQKMALAHDQNFPDMISRQKEFDRRETLEKIFDVTIIENALQPEIRP